MTEIRVGDRFEVTEDRMIEGVGNYLVGMGYTATARILPQVQQWFNLGVARVPVRNRRAGMGVDAAPATLRAKISTKGKVR